MDQNPAILDGKGYLHAMGIISVLTAQEAEGLATLFTTPTVLRKKREKVTNVRKDKGQPIIQYVNHKETDLSKITFKEFLTLLMSY